MLPQLFSRLYNPEQIVRSEISKLICRIGSTYPQDILYATLMGIQEEPSIASKSFELILNSLVKSAPTMIQEMDVWVKELQRITVLWEETWLLGLENIRAELQARGNRFAQDRKRIEQNSTLSDTERLELIEKTQANIFRPVIYNLTKLVGKTFAQGCASTYERAFAAKFEQELLSGIEELKSNSKIPIFDAFNNVYEALLESNQTSRVYELEALSPILFNFNLTTICMPGSQFDGDDLVMSVAKQVHVLPSKTKPKKITLCSSKGVKASYLIKGHEDLHLDERIQQFIKVTNYMLARDKHAGPRQLTSSTYEVIPFGPTFGMIQWIDNVNGIFSLYRKWQQWNHASKLLAKKEKSGPSQPLRPHEFFLLKIQKLIQSGKLSKSTPRNKWPIHLLKQVFLELQAETPKHFLSNELWGNSESTSSWWQKCTVFSRSLAVMSMIGYILGLGDRHLDNILIDLHGGQILHIDFNVCFEKGSRLRIPETVPFRLTQNLINACGPLGIEGHFRISCEQSLRVMRENKEILLTLLETFVYDPLVDWTKEQGNEKQILNLNVNIGILVSRIIESRPALQDLLHQFPIQAKTASYELALLAQALHLEEDLSIEKLQMFSSSQDDLSDSLASLQEDFTVAKARFLEVFERLKAMSSKSLKFQQIIQNLLKEYGNASDPSEIEISLYPAENYSDIFTEKARDANITIKAVKDERALLRDALSNAIGWYAKFFGFNEFLAVSHFYSNRYQSLQNVVEKNFTPGACISVFQEVQSKNDKSSRACTALLSKFELSIFNLSSWDGLTLKKPSSISSNKEIPEHLHEPLLIFMTSEIFRIVHGYERSDFDSFQNSVDIFLKSLPRLYNFSSSPELKLSSIHRLLNAFMQVTKLLWKGKGFREIDRFCSLPLKSLKLLSVLQDEIIPIMFSVASHRSNSNFLDKLSKCLVKGKKCLLLNAASREFRIVFEDLLSGLVELKSQDSLHEESVIFLGYIFSFLEGAFSASKVLFIRFCLVLDLFYNAF